MENTSNNLKRRESLRCLFASVASIRVMDWLLQSSEFKSVIASGQTIDEELTNIRSFFAAHAGFSKEQVRDGFLPIASILSHHIYGALFADAVRWWAASHRTGRDESKYLRDAMYKGEFARLLHHFYHEFRNNHLAHFPGGIDNNDNVFLTPEPYGFFLSQAEYNDFRRLLAHSIKLALLGAEKYQDVWGSFDPFSGEAWDQMSEELREAAKKAFQNALDNLDEDILRIPTRDYFPERGAEPDASVLQ